MENSTPEHATKRPAWQTSAFWVALLAMLLPLLESLLKFLPPQSPWAIVASALVAAGFSISRNLVYKSRNDASGAVEAAKAMIAAPKPDANPGELLTGELLTSIFNEYVPQTAPSRHFAVNLAGMSGVADYVDLTPPGVPLESE